MLKKILALLIFAVPLLVSAQVDTSAISLRLKQQKALNNHVVCLLYKDGKLLYKKESPEFTVKTPQPVAAISQWLTAALVLTFVQEGKLSLDDKVSTYIPLFNKYSKGYITVRNCLTHETGIESDFNITKLFQKSRFKTLEDEAVAYASKREIKTNPGTEFNYSSIGYNLVGRILEVIAKKSFDRLMQDRILRPLGMRGSGFTNDDYNAAVDPSHGGRSTANDLTNFMTMLLNKGSFNNKQVLTESSVNALLSLQVSPPLKNVPKSVDGLSYAFGSWVLEASSKGNPMAFAAPSFAGAWPIVDLCRGYTFIIFTSAINNPPNKDFYLGLKSIVDEALPAKCE